MNVLSLFDGMACGRIALERAGFTVTNYFASEIERWPKQVALFNYPDIKHIGDVRFIDINYHEGITTVENWLTGQKFSFSGKLDLLIGGSPCQDLRPGRDGLAGKKSILFYEYYRIWNKLKDINPDFLFLLENVHKISQDDKKIISDLLSVQPVLINSGLVSAQNRKRYYWSNIPFYGLPEDKGLLLKDVTLNGESYMLRWQNSVTGPVVDVKCNTLKALSGRGGIRQQPLVFKDLILTPEEINKAIISYRGKTWKTGNKMGSMRFPDATDLRSRTVTATKIKTSRETIHILEGENVRNLHPIEYERLQTVPDDYTALAPTTQRYRMLGNGWNVDTIVHLVMPMHLMDIL